MADNTKRNLVDLKNALFNQIQNIQDPESYMLVDEEIKKAGSLCKISEQIIKINQLELDAVKVCISMKKNGLDIKDIPLLDKMLK